MIDTLFMGVLGLILHFVFFGGSDFGLAIGSEGFSFQSNNNWIEQLLFLSITVFMWIKFLGTPGKLLLSCHVVDANTKQQIGVGQALVRYFGYFVSLIPLGLGFFGYYGINESKAFMTS